VSDGGDVLQTSSSSHSSGDATAENKKREVRRLVKTKTMMQVDRNREGRLIADKLGLQKHSYARVPDNVALIKALTHQGSMGMVDPGHFTDSSSSSSDDSSSPPQAKIDRVKRWKRVREALDAMREARNQHRVLPEHQDAFECLESAVKGMQRQVRVRIYKTRLHHANLVERLHLEQKVLIGTLRLLVLIMVFGMFWGALYMAVSIDEQRGLFFGYDAAFDFDGMQGVQTRAQFADEVLPRISAASKDYFPLSSRYFRVRDDAARGHGPTQLLAGAQHLTGPLEGPSFALPGNEYSWTVWVRTSAEFVEGNIVRKRVSGGLSSDKDTCWGVFLTAKGGLEFHYGAHDWYPHDTTLNLRWGDGLVRAACPHETPITAGEEMMLTIVVSLAQIHIFRNDEQLCSVPLARQITDCISGDGLIVGSDGLELGGLRFALMPHPRQIRQQRMFRQFARTLCCTALSEG